MSKTKHNLPGKREKPGPSFIRFSKVQRALIDEILNRQRAEFNVVIGTIYEDLGIAEKILQAPPGKYQLRQDFSGVDIVPVSAPRVAEVLKPEKPEKPESQDKKETKETPKKENTH